MTKSRPSHKKILIVGLGSIGRRHVRNLRALLPDAELAALRRQPDAEPVPGVDHQYHELSGAIAFRPDAAIIASPATEHLSTARSLVENAIPVLVEKPFAERLEGLPELIEGAASRHVPLFVAYNLRFHPLLSRVRSMLARGGIGRVLSVRAEVGQYLPDWRPGQAYQQSVSARRALGGGALLELSHELDYIYWLFGRPARVFASGGRLGDLDIDVEDMVSLVLRYDGTAPVVNISLDFLQRAVTRQFKIVGTEGTILGDMISGQLDVYLAAAGGWAREFVKPADPNQLYLDEVTEFLSCSAGSRPAALADGRQGVDIMCVIEAARRSMTRQEEVEIKYA